MRQGAPLLAVTATATQEVKEDTLKGLGMKADTVHIYVSPDRPNIYLDRLRIDNNLTITFASLVELLKIQSNLTPRTIMYCKSQKECGKLFKHLKYELGEYAYYPPGARKSSSNCLIAMYHANTLAKHKQKVSSSLFDKSGVCRLVFATTALWNGYQFARCEKSSTLWASSIYGRFCAGNGKGWT